MTKRELVKKYGNTMGIQALSEVLGITKGAIYNKISQHKFEIPVYKISGKLIADTSDVAEYFSHAKLIAKRVQYG